MCGLAFCLLSLLFLPSLARPAAHSLCEHAICHLSLASGAGLSPCSHGRPVLVTCRGGVLEKASRLADFSLVCFFRLIRQHRPSWPGGWPTAAVACPSVVGPVGPPPRACHPGHRPTLPSLLLLLVSPSRPPRQICSVREVESVCLCARLTPLLPAAFSEVPSLLSRWPIFGDSAVGRSNIVA